MATYLGLVTNGDSGCCCVQVFTKSWILHERILKYYKTYFATNILPKMQHQPFLFVSSDKF